jgi:hypothetical protein
VLFLERVLRSLERVLLSQVQKMTEQRLQAEAEKIAAEPAGGAAPPASGGLGGGGSKTLAPSAAASGGAAARRTGGGGGAGAGGGGSRVGEATLGEIPEDKKELVDRIIRRLKDAEVWQLQAAVKLLEP